MEDDAKPDVHEVREQLAARPQGAFIQNGSGRIRIPEGQRRDRNMNVSMRKGDLVDLARIARAWGVPVSTVAWALLHQQLSSFRRGAPDLSGTGIVVAASACILEYEQTGAVAKAVKVSKARPFRRNYPSKRGVSVAVAQVSDDAPTPAE